MLNNNYKTTLFLLPLYVYPMQDESELKYSFSGVSNPPVYIGKSLASIYTHNAIFCISKTHDIHTTTVHVQ